MKKVMYGVLASAVFYVVTMIILMPIGSLVFVGDGFTISYHLFTYMGLICLCGVIVTCTLIIVEKLDAIREEISKNEFLDK